MIADEESSLTLHLLSKLRLRFDQGSYVPSPGGRIGVVFPAANPEVGDLEILDDGDELTVYLGNFTHVHFDNHDEGLSDGERAERIAEEVTGFLEEVFADRVEFYASRLGGGGCRERQASRRGVLSRLFFGSRTYVWSGALEEP